eukprot:2241477-Amphidinium_carterae.2
MSSSTFFRVTVPDQRFGGSPERWTDREGLSHFYVFWVSRLLKCIGTGFGPDFRSGNADANLGLDSVAGANYNDAQCSWPRAWRQWRGAQGRGATQT